MAILDATRENFAQTVAASPLPVLVELWAPWCGHCGRLGPVLERLDEELGARLTIARINIDEQPELLREQALDGDVIPTLYLYQNGKHGEGLVNPRSQSELEDWLDEALYS